jgi:hypothetical protein
MDIQNPSIETSRSKRSGKKIKFKETSQTSNNSLMGESMSMAFHGIANQSVNSRASKSSTGSKKGSKKRTLPPKAVKRAGKSKTADMTSKKNDEDNRKRIRNFEEYRVKMQEYSAKSTERLPQLN